MSKFTEEMVDSYADKLLIGLTSEENKMVLDEFDKIDKDMEIVSNIPNIENVKPMTYPLENLKSTLREDIEEPSPAIEDLLRNAGKTMGREIEVDAISDGEEILIPGVMEHLERAGVHSGDSVTMYPSQNISKETKDKVLDYTKKLAVAIGIKGMINIQFIEFEGELYIIEVNPRASRTVPYISKVSKVPIVDLATKVMLGYKLKDLGYGVDIYKEPDLVSVKVPVFSTQKLPKVEVSLGPEMKSTGEVLGVGRNIKEALYKGFVAGSMYPSNKKGKILATIKKHDKKEFLPIAKMLASVGYKFVATEGTANLLREANIEVEVVRKLHEEKPNILDVIKNKEVDLVVNTPTKGNDSNRDGFIIRRAAVERNIGVITALDTLRAIAEVKAHGIEAKDLEVFDITK